MGHKHGSITFQISEAYKKMQAFGESKHQAKRDGTTSDKIYSFSTMKAYTRVGVAFGKYCKSAHGCKTIDACRQYVEEYVKFRIMDKSPYTVKLDVAALAKLYHCRSKDFAVDTPSRIRPGITRSRTPRKMDAHFSEKRNADLVTFCRCTGLRRCEVASVKGTQLFMRDGCYYVHIERGQGKGGRVRDVPIIGSTAEVARVVQLMTAAGSGKVFPRVHAAADIHGYRAEYAATLYKMNARPLDVCRQDRFYNPSRRTLEKNSVYYCRNDEKGRWFDKQAMLIVSQALGHNRICVVGQHYLYNV